MILNSTIPQNRGVDEVIAEGIVASGDSFPTLLTLESLPTEGIDHYKIIINAPKADNGSSSTEIRRLKARNLTSTDYQNCTYIDINSSSYTRAQSSTFSREYNLDIACMTAVDRMNLFDADIYIMPDGKGVCFFKSAAIGSSYNTTEGHDSFVGSGIVLYLQVGSYFDFDYRTCYSGDGYYKVVKCAN